MRARLITLLICMLTACSAGAPQPAPTQGSTRSSPAADPTPAAPEAKTMSSYPDLGPAPEIVGDVWLNTDRPIRLADLRGKVALIEMWTYGCINCRNTISSLREWYMKYAPQGLVVIGNHFPEFSYERDLDNLRQAIEDLNVPYPVVQDNEGANWRAYHNRYWPTLYLVDKQGRLRFIHIGEGRYQETDAAIQALLNEPEPE